ncbi:MAG: hypothetical protein JXQ75_10460 [Phycisphaerae bacterium]|nr:hypothetical protein [Phycisphaerae bacterium]
MKDLNRCYRRIKPALAVGLTSTALFFNGCFDSDIAKRFREAYAPGFIEGLSTALGEAGQAEAGLRQMGTALADALGAVIEPRTSVSSSGSSGSSGTSTSGS